MFLETLKLKNWKNFIAEFLIGCIGHTVFRILPLSPIKRLRLFSNFSACLSLPVLATILTTMTLDEKVRELFVVPGCPLREEEHLNTVRDLRPGGILFKQSQTPSDQINFIHKLEFDPLRIGDAERGVNMRISKQVVHWPKNMTLGAIKDLHWLEAMGHQIGKECSLTGIDINLAPVVDVNTNPKNPIIGIRAFGDCPETVAKKGVILMKAMQEEGVAATAKHYPGHGDTTVDSHLGLPAIDHLELKPFEAMVKEGVECVMTAHLLYDKEIVTFSPKIVQGILRDQWHFNGLIITDALNMKALPEKKPGENAVRALEAGHDLLLYGDHISEKVDDILNRHVPQAIKAVKDAVLSGRISEETLNDHVERVLKFKEKAKRRRQPLTISTLETTQVKKLKTDLFRQAITLLGTLPPNGAIVFSVTNVTDEVKKELENLKKSKKPYVVVLYTSPYALVEIGAHPHILVAYEEAKEARSAVDEVLAGKLKPIGVLPVGGFEVESNKAI